MKYLRLIFKIVLLTYLVAYCLLYGYGFWEVTNWYELFIAFLYGLFVPALLLIFVSIWLRKETFVWAKHLAEVGLLVGALSLVLPVIMIFWDFYLYYNDPAQPFSHLEFHFPNPFKYLPLPPGWY